MEQIRYNKQHQIINAMYSFLKKDSSSFKPVSYKKATL